MTRTHGRTPQQRTIASLVEQVQFITMTTTSTSRDEEAQQLTAAGDVEEGGALFLVSGKKDPIISLWNCGFCFFCLSCIVLTTLALFSFFQSTAIINETKRWRPVVDVLNASNISTLKYSHDVGNSGLQGLAFNRDCSILYEFHTLGVRVLNMNTTDSSVLSVAKSRVYTSNDFPVIYTKQIAHVGGIDYASSVENGQELWIATHSEGIDGEGAIVAVDPVSLSIKQDRMVRTHYNLDWVAHSNGILYYGEFFHVKSVKRVSLATLEPLPDLQLQLPPHLSDAGLNYIQSAAIDLEGRLVLLGDDYQCTVYVVDIDNGNYIQSQALLLGSETDGITFNHQTRSMLVGFNRQHSHEQVMGQDDMISIIQLDFI